MRDQPEFDDPLAEVEIGTTFGPVEIVVSRETNDQFMFAMQDYDPRYTTGTGEVHPGAVISIAMGAYFGNVVAPGWTGRHAGDEVQFVAPIYVGEKLLATFAVADRFESKGRPGWVRECEIRGADGTLRLKRRSYSLLLKDVEGA